MSLLSTVSHFMYDFSCGYRLTLLIVRFSPHSRVSHGRLFSDFFLFISAVLVKKCHDPHHYPVALLLFPFS